MKKAAPEGAAVIGRKRPGWAISFKHDRRPASPYEFFTAEERSYRDHAVGELPRLERRIAAGAETAGFLTSCGALHLSLDASGVRPFRVAMSTQAYTVLFYVGGEEEVFSRHCDYASDADAIRDAKEMLIRLRNTQPATVTSIAVGRGVDLDHDDGPERIAWLGAWEWDGALRWAPEV